MTSHRRFSRPVLAAIGKDRILGVRAGMEDHRFIGVWAVVVDGRVFIRSWGLERRSWFHTFQAEPRGAIRVGEREMAVRAVRVTSERTKAAVDEAYAEKYDTPGAIKYVRGFARSRRRRDTTTELRPA